MPNINRIRVNNVKYNFGSQFYDDFTMRLYGKNTLYDLANGGGKSVLMLLLMQNMIPNCTLDEKQPIEKLFRMGNANTTIHSLVEWKLDADDEDGFRYMTTGFCARKAKDAEGASGEASEKTKDVASIEYFNYCIFYREYNKNDIVNLPLAKDGERITFSGLRAYLKELPHKDLSLRVQIFDRKGEYQRYISNYGIHESQWEIIRGINKTEGHVRAYFENNYKTTRRVVEDLLIEEIIEKANSVKTSSEDESSVSMAKMLMDIKEQLAELARKKKDMAAYGHQIELIRLLRDKVSSFMELYLERSRLTKYLADICVTGEMFAKNDEQEVSRLQTARDEKLRQKDAQKKRIECLKIAKGKNDLKEIKAEIDELSNKLDTYKDKLDKLEHEKRMKECINEYLEYLDEKNRYSMNDAIIKNMLSESAFDEELLYEYVYNIKMCMDVVIADLDRQIDAIDEELAARDAKITYQAKRIEEAKVGLAIWENTRRNLGEEITAFSGRLSDISMALHDMRFVSTNEQQEDKRGQIDDMKKKMEESKKAVFTLNDEIVEDRLKLMSLEAACAENKKRIADLSKNAADYEKLQAKLHNIMTIYGAKDIEELSALINSHITEAVLRERELNEKLKRLEKKVERLADGRIIDISRAAAKVIDYIETRHGVTAMYGMDYISALPAGRQRELLEVNPELPYGVIVKDYERIREDAGIMGIDSDGIVNIFDLDKLEQRAVHYGNNAFPVSAKAEYLTDTDTVTRLIQKENDGRGQIKEQLAVNGDMLKTYREDLEFVYSVKDGDALKAKSLQDELKKQDAKYEGDIIKLKENIKNAQLLIEQKNAAIAEYDLEYNELLSDMHLLNTINELTKIIDKKEAEQSEAEKQIARLKEDLEQLLFEDEDISGDNAALSARKKFLESERLKQLNEWESVYKPYYNLDKEYDVLTLSDDELKARFTAMITSGREDSKTIDDKRALMDTLKSSMDRILNGIEKKGVSLDELKSYEEKNLLFFSDAEAISVNEKQIEDMLSAIKDVEDSKKDKLAAANRLEGSIEYGVASIEAAYGAYEDIELAVSDIISGLKNGEEVLLRLAKEAKDCDDAYRQYMKQQGYMTELYKDVKRIVTADNIDLSEAEALMEDKERLRDIFEDTLIRYDRNKKNLERAGNELVKFKGNTAAALDSLKVYALAKTIREDVVIPDNYNEAELLTKNLKEIEDYIGLEKDRVLKSLADMETIKENFEEQCLQRCLDVKTELDKLPKLSKIICDGEAIQMVGLVIPYVKEEFRKQRMSEYIDKVVAQADDYASDKERVKFIRSSLTLKKLFGVIVTDMNAIKLNLYKRERIKEQSRYLKYEEAVGSTGQSQGIYIQFLISIINYISGMYRISDKEARTKTIFIDNPFGAAKDVYIWEPIFALLHANNVQLIVPARGATPAITGRFDVNYILGQQMAGGRQLTVVTDYTSRIDQQEVEYKDLEYEQVSFGFI